MITNKTGISLALAVWAVNDDYDYQKTENYISATGLMKPLRQIVLPRRIPHDERPLEDVSDCIARALGHSIHDSVEKAWVQNYRKNLKRLGTPDHVIDCVLVNQTDEEIVAWRVENPGKTPILVYVEQRAMKKVKTSRREWIVGGKFDMVSDGIVQDFKSTTAYTWVFGGRDDEHALQGSLYRWLNPDKIKEDYIRINYIFTDWQKFQAQSNPKYPQQRLEHKDIPLLDITDTEKWVINKLEQVERYMTVPEDQIPHCTDEELWMSDPVFKYYAKPETAMAGGRATKNCDSMAEAREYMAGKGGKGTIITVKGEPKRCGYCDAFEICTQKDQFESFKQG